jgi:hypothetical protein
VPNGVTPNGVPSQRRKLLIGSRREISGTAPAFGSFPH